MLIEMGSAAIGTWLWDKYGGTLLEQLGKSLGKDWERFQQKSDWEEALRKYTEHLKDLHGTVRLRQHRWKAFSPIFTSSPPFPTRDV